MSTMLSAAAELAWFLGPVGETNRVRPKIVCADGTTLSVQASAHHYCFPRSDEGPWTCVEVAHPSSPVGPEWAQLRRDDGSYELYEYVPTVFVARYIKSHGGFAKAEGDES